MLVPDFPTSESQIGTYWNPQLFPVLHSAVKKLEWVESVDLSLGKSDASITKHLKEG